MILIISGGAAARSDGNAKRLLVHMSFGKSVQNVRPRRTRNGMTY